MSKIKPEPKAYAVETIDGSTKLFNNNELKEAQRLFDSRGTSMFALYMHPVEKEPLTDIFQANAAVIAAAPELLETLEDVSEFLNFAWADIEMNEYSFNLLEDAICKTQKAIAKAKGENE